MLPKRPAHILNPRFNTCTVPPLTLQGLEDTIESLEHDSLATQHAQNKMFAGRASLHTRQLAQLPKSLYLLPPTRVLPPELVTLHRKKVYFTTGQAAARTLSRAKNEIIPLTKEAAVQQTCCYYDTTPYFQYAVRSAAGAASFALRTALFDVLPTISSQHGWAIAPQYIEQYKIALSAFKVGVCVPQHCSAIAHPCFTGTASLEGLPH